MTDLAQTIIPKSDQLNADDLIAGPITITITDVAVVVGSEQPAAIHFEGDNGKPYKPCKSMRRLLVMLWGSDTKTFPGRRLTLFREPTVRFGSDEVGGIRISHMSHIDRERTVPLTATRGRRKPFTVKPLAAPKQRGAGDASTNSAASPSATAAAAPSDGAGKVPPPASSRTFPGDLVSFAGERYDPAEPCEIAPPIAFEDMSGAELTSYAAAIAECMKRGPGQQRQVWLDNNANHILRLKALKPALVSRLEQLATESASADGGAPDSGAQGPGAPSHIQGAA